MKQYLLAVHIVEGSSPAEEELQETYDTVGKFNAELQAAGAWVFAGGLHPSSASTVVRARGGEIVVTDGPFAETKEQIGGFWVIRAPDLDKALEWAGKGAQACGSPVEVRPFQDDGTE